MSLTGHRISLIKLRYFSFLRTALLLRLHSKPAVNSRTYRPLDWIRKRRSGPGCIKPTLKCPLK